MLVDIVDRRWQATAVLLDKLVGSRPLSPALFRSFGSSADAALA
jgi:hypothetical protein